ncbi:MAG TPA: SRPBCC family protein [Myxococcales bacterium]|jgi:carbon monoxide dehydrogenase subunit G
MRLESQRTLHLPGTPEEIWPLISDPSRLPVLAPEVEDAWPARDGLVRLVARVGRRRRAWNVKLTLDEARHHLELTSATEGVRFELVVDLEKSGDGSRVQVKMELVPPEVWKAAPQAGGIPRRVVSRLLLSVLLFVLSAFGVVELPALHLPPVAEAFAYAVVGLSFVIGAALLSGTHSPRKGKARRRLLPLPRLGGKTPPKTG